MGSVSWHNHKNFLLDKVQNLLKTNSLLDCTLAAEGQYLRAHRLILASSSPYFELLFNQENEKNPIVILKDVKFEELKSIINFIYYGEVQVLVNEMESFFKTAEMLQIIGLIDLNKQRVGKENSKKKNIIDRPSVMCNSYITANKSLETNSRETPLSNNTQFDCSNKSTSASASIPVALSSNSSILSYDDTRLNDWKLQKIYAHKENSFPSSLERFISTVDNNDNENSMEYNQDFVMQTCVNTEGDNTQAVILNNKRETVCNSRFFGSQANNSDNVQNSNSKLESHCAFQESASESVVDDHISCGFSNLKTNICVKPESGMVENSTERQMKSKPANDGFDSDDVTVSFSEPRTKCVEGNDNTKVNYLPSSHLVVIKEEPSEFSPRDHVECEMQSDYMESDTVPVDSSVYLNEDRMRNNTAATSADNAVSSLMDDYSVLEKLQSMPETIIHRTSSGIPQSGIETSESRSNGKKVLFCPYCNKEFPWVSTLELHIRSHTGEKPYWCQYCDAKFARKDYLQTHMVRHSGQKRFECLECGKRFTQKHNLKYHEDAHKGLKRFQCLKCNKRFTQKGSLNAHLASCVGENPFLYTIS